MWRASGSCCRRRHDGAPASGPQGLGRRPGAGAGGRRLAGRTRCHSAPRRHAKLTAACRARAMAAKSMWPPPRSRWVRTAVTSMRRRASRARSAVRCSAHRQRVARPPKPAGGSSCKTPAGAIRKDRAAASMVRPTRRWCRSRAPMRWAMPDGRGAACPVKPSGRPRPRPAVRMRHWSAHQPHGHGDAAAARSAAAGGPAPSAVIKGGSFLCAATYCVRYRASARHPHEAHLPAAHVGFRTARPA